MTPAVRAEDGRAVSVAVARALTIRGEHDSAAALARRACELSQTDRDRAAARLHEGLSLLASGRLEAADEALRDAAAASADTGLVAYHRGRLQVAWKDDIEALVRFEECLASGTRAVDLHDLHLEMALSHIRLEEYPEARVHLELAADEEPAAAISFNIGICDLNEGRIEAGLARFDEAMRLGPEADDIGRILFYRGHALNELGRFEEAIEALERSMEADPGELATHNLLGYCCYRLGRHREAVDCFRRAIEIDPSSAIDWANLGSNLRELGEIDEAIAMYRRALALDPTIGFAAENLERLTASHGRPPTTANAD